MKVWSESCRKWDNFALCILSKISSCGGKTKKILPLWKSFTSLSGTQISSRITSRQKMCLPKYGKFSKLIKSFKPTSKTTKTIFSAILNSLRNFLLKRFLKWSSSTTKAGSSTEFKNSELLALGSLVTGESWKKSVFRESLAKSTTNRLWDSSTKTSIKQLSTNFIWQLIFYDDPDFPNANSVTKWFSCTQKHKPSTIRLKSTLRKAPNSWTNLNNSNANSSNAKTSIKIASNTQRKWSANKQWFQTKNFNNLYKHSKKTLFQTLSSGRLKRSQSGISGMISLNSWQKCRKSFSKQIQTYRSGTSITCFLKSSATHSPTKIFQFSTSTSLNVSKDKKFSTHTNQHLENENKKR